MNFEEAIKILSEAESGNLTVDDKFKEACRKGRVAIMFLRDIANRIMLMEVEP